MPSKRQETTAHVHSPAIEDYLEQIHNLIEGKGYARVVDIAKNLGISQASVTNMIQHTINQNNTKTNYKIKKC
ncbi:MAG: hypothetical protein NTV80_22850 [Verrucomicrobia bacterium]|nr:hypothetical protein [Verrucomicrobiota bacterium]